MQTWCKIQIQLASKHQIRLFFSGEFKSGCGQWKFKYFLMIESGIMYYLMAFVRNGGVLSMGRIAIILFLKTWPFYDHDKLAPSL